MEFAAIEPPAQAARADGQQVVLVLGLGFVGTAVAGNLARAEKLGRRLYFVIGLDRDDAPGREKAGRLDADRSPTYANDPSLERVVHGACAVARNLVGTVDPRAIALADIVVSCINLACSASRARSSASACRRRATPGPCAWSASTCGPAKYFKAEHKLST